MKNFVNSFTLLAVTVLSLTPTASVAAESQTVAVKSTMSKSSVNPSVVHTISELDALIKANAGKFNKNLTENERGDQTKTTLAMAEYIYGKTHSRDAYNQYLTDHGFIVYQQKEQPANTYSTANLIQPMTGSSSEPGDTYIETPSWSYNYNTGIWTLTAGFSWTNDDGWYEDDYGSTAGPDQFGVNFSKLSYSVIYSSNLTTYWADNTVGTNNPNPNATTASDSSGALALMFSGNDTVKYYDGTGNYQFREYSWEYGDATYVFKSSFAGVGSSNSVCAFLEHTWNNNTITSVSVSATNVSWSTTNNAYSWKAMGATTAY